MMRAPQSTLCAAYAQEPLDELKAEELRAKPVAKTAVDTEEIWQVPGVAGVAEEPVAALEEAGFQIGEGADSLEDDLDPSPADLLSTDDLELDGAALDALSDDFLAATDE